MFFGFKNFRDFGGLMIFFSFYIYIDKIPFVRVFENQKLRLIVEETRKKHYTSLLSIIK